jgi:hypothetical protein
MLLLILSLLLTVTATSTILNIYVSPNGSDASTGVSPLTAFATLERAFNAVESAPRGGSGATVLLGGGVYERTSATLSAAAAGVGPIIVRALNADNPAILSGGARVHGWTTKSGNRTLWTAPLPSNVSECTLLCDLSGSCRTRARIPNFGAYLTWASPLCPDVHSPSCGETARWGFIFAEGDISPNLYDLEHVEVSVYGGWTASRNRISAVYSANHTVLLQNPSNFPIGFWPNNNSEGGGRYFIDNVREGLDAQGEFYCDFNTREVLYIPLDNEDLSTLDVYIAVSLEVINVNNISDGVTIEGPGLSIAHTAWSCDFAAGQTCDFQSTAWQNYAAIHVTNASRVNVTGVEVTAVGGAAIWFDENVSDCVVQSNYIHDLAAGGVRVGTSKQCANGTNANIDISNNVIGRGGLVFPDGTGILIHAAENVTIAHNEIAYLSYTGVSVGWCWAYNLLTRVGDHLIHDNYVHHLGTGLQRQLGDAMACFYSLGHLGHTDVHHNVCSDVAAYYTGGFGTSQDQASSGYNFHHNIVARTSGAGVNQHYGTNNAVWNNVVADSNLASATLRNRGSVRTVPQANLPNEFNFTRNIIWQTNSTAALFDDVFLSWTDIGGDAGGPLNHSFWSVTFQNNVYFNPFNLTLPELPVWGGCKSCQTPFQLTLSEWQRGCGTDWTSASSPAGRNCSGGNRGPLQDIRSVFADPLFADADNLNFSLLEGSPALSLGFEQIDVQTVGPQDSSWPSLTPLL